MTIESRTTREERERMLELDAKATPGPWARCVYPYAERGYTSIKALDTYGAPTSVLVAKQSEYTGCPAEDLLLVVQARTFAPRAARHIEELIGLLRRLSNEVLGSLPLIEELLRQEIGNTNFTILLQRAEEARAALAEQGEQDAETSSKE
jgi:hypothetical protein